MITRALTALAAFACALHVFPLPAQSESPDRFMPDNPQRTGSENSDSFSVKYTLLMPSEKSSELVAKEERNPFGKGDEEMRDVSGKSSSEETKIQEQLSKLHATGLSPGPNGLRVLFGDMWLSKNDVMPPVIRDQTLALRVNDVTREAIQLVWMEKKFTGLPPRLLVIPVDLRATVHRVPHGQVPEKTETNKQRESKASKLATAVEIPASALMAQSQSDPKASQTAAAAAPAEAPPASAPPPSAPPSTDPAPAVASATKETASSPATPDESAAPPSENPLSDRLPKSFSMAQAKTTEPASAPQEASARALAGQPPPSVDDPSQSSAKPAAAPAPEPASWKRAMGLMENLVKEAIANEAPPPTDDPPQSSVKPATTSATEPAATPAREPASWKRAMGLTENPVKLSEASK